jgi:uncharacterized protein (TIGR02001 family)
MKKLRGLLVIVTSVFVFSDGSAQGLSLSGDVSVVSTYVWRGVRQFNGSAVQGTVGASFNALSFGVWASNVNFGDDTLIETDPFVEIALPTGDLSSALGLVYYSYDFTSYNDQADGEIELYGTLGYGPAGLGVFYVPSQGSTEGDVNDSFYWITAGVAFPVSASEFSVGYEFGTYSSRFLPEPTEDAMGVFVLGWTRPVTETVSISWNYVIPSESQIDNSLWIGLSVGY